MRFSTGRAVALEAVAVAEVATAVGAAGDDADRGAISYRGLWLLPK
jgi:hypothetical protein